jgi:hypothetical protein
MVSNRGAILHIFWRLKVRFRPVQTGSAGQCYALNLELDRRSSSTISLNFWTEPGFGSARFRFELWFRTEPQHHYMVASMASLAETRDSTIDQVYLVNYKVANSGSSTFIVGEIIELVQCCSLRTKQEVLIFSGLCLSQMSRPCKAAAARVSALIACAVMLFRCRPET